MSDIALKLGTYAADLVLDQSDLQCDDGLETAILISLFTDHYVSSSELPAEELSQRGWWGDSVSFIPDDTIGSKLWLLQREKITAETLQRAKSYAEQALQWLIDDNIVKSLEVSVTRSRIDALWIEIILIRPSGERLSLRYENIWQAQTLKPTTEKVCYAIS
jgi:phage gp46-like protein